MDLHNILAELMDCSSSAARAMQMRLSETERKAAGGERGGKKMKTTEAETERQAKFKLKFRVIYLRRPQRRRISQALKKGREGGNRILPSKNKIKEWVKREAAADAPLKFSYLGTYAKLSLSN